MKVMSRLSSLLLAALVPLACSTTNPERLAGSNYPDRIDAFGQPVAIGPGKARGQGLSANPGESLRAVGPVVVNMSEVPVRERPAWNTTLEFPANKRNHAPGPVSDEVMDRLREQALNLPPNARAPQVRSASLGEIAAGAPVSSGSFDGPDSADCCGGTYVTVPPDPEMAAGQNHVIAAVNSAFVIYNKANGANQGPRTFEDFFSGLSMCQDTFDPNVIYDESANRFFMGIVGNGSGTHYCMAVSQTGDPTGNWYQYALQVDKDGNFFDFPHAGVGVDAIYISGNMFAASFVESVLWAVNKAQMYAGSQTVGAKFHSAGTDFTPQPMNIHGDAFPATGSPHYFIANDVASNLTWNANEFAVYRWADPFGTDTFQFMGGFSLASVSPLTAGAPVSQPQKGGRRAHILDGGDWRIQDAEYNTADGTIAMVQTVGCNPGGGTVNCIRWAEIDPVSRAVVDIGMIQSSGEYRSYADAAFNSCGDIAVGYTKTSSSMFPGVFAAAREGAPGTTVDTEVELKAGETTYSSFQNFRQPTRWGDYTGMTIDPDGKTFWYLGEYAKDSGYSTNWGTYISAFTLASCDGGGPVDLTPTAVDDSFALDLQNGANPSVSGNVVSNDDLGNPPTAASVLTGPASGSLSFAANGDFSYTPTGTGTFSFTYQIEDGDGDTDSGNVIITVSNSGPPDLQPNAVDDNYSLDVAVNGSVSGTVTVNDDLGDGLGSVSFDSPANGALSGTTASGGFTYTPGDGFTGTDSFPYTLTDADGDTSSATVRITVTDSSSSITVSANGYKLKGVNQVDLTWSGAGGEQVDIRRDSADLTTTANDGAYTDNTTEKGGRTYTYEVCETGGGACGSATVVF